MKAIHFEMASFLLYAVAIVVIATRYRNHRDYGYALIGCSLAFPFEWGADKYWMFLDYDWSFRMLVDRLPLMMPFAWGWFFGIPLIVCLRFQDKIDAIPLWARWLVLYAIFWPWDFIVEYSSTTYRLWVYHWPEGSMIGGILPWFIPTMVATANTTLYFAHKIALRYSEGKGWFHGFSIHVLAYYLVFTLQVAVGWPLIRMMGIRPIVVP